MPTARKRNTAKQQIDSDPASGAHTSRVSSKVKDKKSKAEGDVEPEIVGGLNGDYRITGNESSSSHITFTIPTEDNKVIPCQLYGRTLPSSSSASESDTEYILIFTHGAGGGLENPATQLFAEGYGSIDTPVLCFQGTMNLQSRVKSFETVFKYCRKKYPDCQVAVGGRSMGARAAVILAQKHEEVQKMILVSYPLTSPKGEIRDRILVDLSNDKKVLFLSGDQDSMCDVQELNKVRRRMVAKSNVVLVIDADHGMSLVRAGKNKANAVENVRKSGGKYSANWVRGERNENKDIVSMEWDKDEQKIVFSESKESVNKGAEEQKDNASEQKEGKTNNQGTKKKAMSSGVERKRKAEVGQGQKMETTKRTKSKQGAATNQVGSGSKQEEHNSGLRRSTRKKK